MGLLPNWRAWHLLNVDTGEELEGSFEAEPLVETPGAPSYAAHTSLNRTAEILQFLHGNADRMTFGARLYGATAIDNITDELEKLKEWSKSDTKVNRPPILVFWIGSSDIYLECVIENLGDITYDRITSLGNLRGAAMQITLRQYVPFEIAGEYLHETRYARAKQGEYYELLGHVEYGAPLLGVLVRRRHPDQLDLEAGDIVKLPTAEALRTTPVLPESIPFEDSFIKRDTPTKLLREAFLDLRGGVYESHILLEG